MENVRVFFLIIKSRTIINSCILFMSVYLERIKSILEKDTCMPIFIWNYEQDQRYGLNVDVYYQVNKQG